MPFFVFLGRDIYQHFSMAMASEHLELFSLPGHGPVSVPCMVLYLALNVATQYACISAVFVLTTECASLTVTLVREKSCIALNSSKCKVSSIQNHALQVVTLRKFLSLLFSIWYFRNPFTAAHWAGTFLVFSGTLLFSDVHGMARDWWTRKDKKED